MDTQSLISDFISLAQHGSLLPTKFLPGEQELEAKTENSEAQRNVERSKRGRCLLFCFSLCLLILGTQAHSQLRTLMLLVRVGPSLG